MYVQVAKFKLDFRFRNFFVLHKTTGPVCLIELIKEVQWIKGVCVCLCVCPTNAEPLGFSPMHESDIFTIHFLLLFFSWVTCHHFFITIWWVLLHFYIWTVILGMDNVCMFASLSAEEMFEVSLQW